MKSIIFNDEMVRAVLAGNKTVTRRPVKQKLIDNLESCKVEKDYLWVFCEDGEHYHLNDFAPFKVGEVIYMRECFALDDDFKDGIIFRADFCKEIKELCPKLKWTPSIHMSEKDSRLKMRITECYAEKLQDIPDDDFEKEGVEKAEIKSETSYWKEFYTEMCKRFMKLWDSCYESPIAWKDNPYVWVIRFEVVSDE